MCFADLTGCAILPLFIGFINKIGMWQYIKDVRAELKHVSWPTRAQTILYTVVVIAISLATAVYLGLLDYIFTEGILRIFI